jgi:7-carboxy-7-deazaguanine synthase
MSGKPLPMLKAHDANDKRILISEVYGPVCQGEGPVAGRATIFIRTFACDSRCKVCDTLYAVEPERSDSARELMSPVDIMARVDAISTTLPITLSGGNPALWDLNELLDVIPPERKVWVETQGTYWRPWLKRCNMVIVSPKGPFMADSRYGLTSLEQLAHFHTEIGEDRLFFKVVIGGHEDLDYAEAIARHFGWRPMYLSVGAPREDSVLRIGVGKVSKEVAAAFLLDRYRALTELLLSNPVRWRELNARAHFLPQLHILTHGEARKV